MLVISRRDNESIVFPSLGIRVQILRSSAASVRLGVEAPADVRVLRSELLDQESSEMAPRQSSGSEHLIRNAMCKLHLAVHLSRKQLAAGRIPDAEATLARAMESVARMEHILLEKKAAQESSSHRYKALIVEDDDNERELLAELLRLYGCDCVTARDGEDALARLASGVKPDVVIMDLQMPRCDGLEMLRRLRADECTCQLRVLMLSGSDPRERGVAIGPGGVDAWFQKPLNTARLWQAIQESSQSPAGHN